MTGIIIIIIIIIIIVRPRVVWRHIGTFIHNNHRVDCFDYFSAFGKNEVTDSMLMSLVVTSKTAMHLDWLKEPAQRQ